MTKRIILCGHPEVITQDAPWEAGAQASDRGCRMLLLLPLEGLMLFLGELNIEAKTNC